MQHDHHPNSKVWLTIDNSKNKKALDAFLKASPKDPTKTTRLSHYNKATPKKSEYFYNKSN